MDNNEVIPQSVHYDRLPDCIKEQLLEDIRKNRIKKAIARKIKEFEKKRRGQK